MYMYMYVWDNQISTFVPYLQVLESLSFDEVEIWFTVSLRRLSHRTLAQPYGAALLPGAGWLESVALTDWHVKCTAKYTDTCTEKCTEKCTGMHWQKLYRGDCPDEGRHDIRCHVM